MTSRDRAIVLVAMWIGIGTVVYITHETFIVAVAVIFTFISL